MFLYQAHPAGVSLPSATSRASLPKPARPAFSPSYQGTAGQASRHLTNLITGLQFFRWISTHCTITIDQTFRQENACRQHPSSIRQEALRRMLELFRRLLQVPVPDPEDARRRAMLNILLLGCLFLAAVGILMLLLGMLLNKWTFQQAASLLAILGLFFLLIPLIYFINRRWGQPAVYLFLAFLIAGYIFGDTPAQISNGSSVLYFAVPVLVASLLIHPLAGFLVAAIGCGIVAWANSLAVPGSFPNFIVMLGFFMLALISWVASYSLREVLKNLRNSNAELDRMVRERNADLAAALARQQEQAGQSNAILDSIADGVLVFDLNGRAIIANPSSLRLLDLPGDTILGSTLAALSESIPLDKDSRLVLSNLAAHPELKHTGQNIDWRGKTLSVTSAPVTDSHGDHLGTVAVFRDYTHETEVDHMKDTFLAIVSHELRTPLFATLGYVEMLKEAVYGPVDEKQAQALDKITANSNHLLEIVSDLLDQAQMEAGKLNLQARPFRPADLLISLHSVMDRIAASKGLSLVTELDPAIPEQIQGDLVRLQQILVNLVNNAVKFTDKGAIHVNLRRLAETAWSLEVQDTGRGIRPEHLGTIFEAFRQVDNPASHAAGGFGLGLAIVKQLTGLMGGEITVESQVGSGSRFTVRLPLVPLLTPKP
jgi:signal transduction histidine kinase